MPKRASPTRSTAAAKAKRAPRPKRVETVVVPTVVDMLEADDDLEVTGPVARVRETVRITTETAAAAIGLSDRQIRAIRSKGAPVPRDGIKSMEEIGAINRWLRAEAQREAKAKADAAIEAAGGMSEEMIAIQRSITGWKLDETKLGKEIDKLLPKGMYYLVLSMMLSEASDQLKLIGIKTGAKLAAESDVNACIAIVDEHVAMVLKTMTFDDATNLERLAIDAGEDDLDDDDED